MDTAALDDQVPSRSVTLLAAVKSPWERAGVEASSAETASERMFNMVLCVKEDEEEEVEFGDQQYKNAMFCLAQSSSDPA